MNVSIANEEVCGTCGEAALEPLWNLPRLPLTECFGQYDPGFPAYDQQLMMCGVCTHTQLLSQLPPNVLYTPLEYYYRSGKAMGTPKRVRSFVDFTMSQFDTAKKLSVVDIGGNDQCLIAGFTGCAKNLALIDPIRVSDDGTEVDGVQIYGRFVEEMDLSVDLSDRPDLIICAHTLEHIPRPHEVLTKLFSECPAGCVLIFEVPCRDSMIANGRLDGVFHQHLHYFSVHTFDNLVRRSGGTVVDLKYNDQPTLGGSFMAACRPIHLRTTYKIQDNSAFSRKVMGHEFRHRFTKTRKRFEEEMMSLRSKIANSERPLYGYGASLMLPVTMYHLGLPSGCLAEVLDDDLEKSGWQYTNLNLKIIPPLDAATLQGSDVLITSVENREAIAQKLSRLNPAAVYTPTLL